MARPVRIERQDDGRHAVIDGEGRILGLHKSVWSAGRQMHEYYGKPGSASTPDKIPAPKIPRSRVPRQTVPSQSVPDTMQKPYSPS